MLASRTQAKLENAGQGGLTKSIATTETSPRSNPLQRTRWKMEVVEGPGNTSLKKRPARNCNTKGDLLHLQAAYRRPNANVC